MDGVLYLAVSRHGYANDGGYSCWLQQTWDASIIKSEDHGKSWKDIPKVGQAMFPGHLFSDPFFVQYGKNGQGTKDGADQFVYALSNDVIWNNGSWMTMGRVRRARIARLDPQDWAFIQRFDKDRVPIWGPAAGHGALCLPEPRSDEYDERCLHSGTRSLPHAAVVLHLS